MKDVEFLQEWQPSNLENPWTQEFQDLKKQRGGGGWNITYSTKQNDHSGKKYLKHHTTA